MGIPLAIGWNDIPGRGGRAGVIEHFLVGGLILWPKLPLFDIGHGKFPVFLGGVEAFEEAVFLLIAGNIEEELQYDDAVIAEILLKLIDFGKPLGPEAIAFEIRG